MSEYLKNTGYDLQTLTISGIFGTVDIKENLYQMDIYENLFAPTITAQLTLIEALSLTELLPIIGEETIKVEFRTSDQGDFKTISLEFDVYKVDQIDELNRSTKLIVLNLIDKADGINAGIRISRSYYDKYSKMVSNICTNLLKIDIDIEETKNFYNHVVPNWTPFKTINQLTLKSERMTGEGVNYIFYQSNTGFKFKSIESLMEADVATELFIEYPTKDKLTAYSTNQILAWEIQRGFNVQENRKNGLYASRSLIHNLTNKNYSTLDHEYDSSTFSELTHLDKNEKPSRFTHDRTEPPMVSFMQLPMVSDDHRSAVDVRLKQKRMWQMQQLRNFMLYSKIAGDSNLEVGQIFKVNIPSTRIKKNASGSDDEYLSGNYLVSAIRHTLDRKEYYMAFELRKDSYRTKHKELT